ncbi:MAG: ribosome-associated translation inhibitor RaiA [Oscillospiraceae bacterium]|nr:ribosome-associated translation inhibitor RaiA [Oscillospiraceae bacterium]
MKFEIIGRKTEVSDKAKDYVTKKLSKLDKFFKEEPNARIVIGKIKEKDYIETTIYAVGMIYRAEVKDEIFAAIDKTVDIIERQIRKNKTRLEKKIKHGSVLDNILISGENEVIEEEKEFKIVKTKTFRVKPMNVEEAVLQMNLLNHNFYVFKNADTNNMNVVYKRTDGNYAVIESVE